MTGVGKGSTDDCSSDPCEYVLRALIDSEEARPTPHLLANKSDEERKQYPLKTGVIDYFRDALLAIARHSLKGNNQHNPGEPLHWARDKSTDQDDCIARHLATADDEEHMTALAWRTLAKLQLFLEQKYNIQPPPGAR